jgi:hypothetical protein
MYFFNTTGGSGSGAGAGTGSAGLGGATASGVSFFLPVYFLKIFIKNQIVHVRFFFFITGWHFQCPEWWIWNWQWKRIRWIEFLYWPEFRNW